MATDRDLLLARRWSGPGRSRWLALDLLGGDRILELDDPSLRSTLAPGAVVAAEEFGEPLEVPGGGLAVSEGLLWSFLDPCRAAPEPTDDPTDRLAIETQLRRLRARRFLA